MLSLLHDSERIPNDESEYVKAAFLAHDPKMEVKRSYAERMEKELSLNKFKAFI